MPKGISIHIGLNKVDKAHYGIELKLPWCRNDAEVMHYIADKNGFETHLLLDEEATSYDTIYLINAAAANLEDGDILFVSFSGHGTNFKDLNGDEEDGYDEALVFYDRVVLDDELQLLWANFRPGVRILFIADACNSGTVTKNFRAALRRFFGAKPDRYDELPFVYEQNKQLYDARFKNIPAKLNTEIACTVLLIAACQDNEEADAGLYSDDELSIFTEALWECWGENSFEGSYKNLFELIRSRLKENKCRQHPNYNCIGSVNDAFEHQIPFTI